MKATGIIRKIDDIGRVVIPKEIRKQMKIKDNCPLEIFTYNGAVCFKPYKPYGAQDWERARRVLSVLLTCGFTLLDFYGGVQATHIKDSNEMNVSYEIFANGELVAYLTVNKDESADCETQIESALAVLKEIFESE